MHTAEPKIIAKAAFTVMGVMARFEPGKPGFFDDMWMKRFMAVEGQIKPSSTDHAYYGLFVHEEGTDAMEYLAGMAVKNGSAVPAGLAVREVPAARYAVFECQVKSIVETAEYAFEKWMADSPYEYDDPKCDFERYPPEAATPESPVHIYIPVRAKGA